MNSQSIQLATRMIALLALVFGFNLSNACDRTNLQLDSIVFSGGSYNVYMTQNVGAGITGSIRGADNSTGTFAYGFWGSPSLSMNGPFTSPVVSDFTGSSQPGTNVGPALGANFAIVYFSLGTPFTCVNSTAGCGNVHVDSKQVHFPLNELPDSVRLFGVEGSGNPTQGCFPDNDMLIDFTTLPVVWNHFSGVAENNEVELTWSTAQEANTDYYSVQRSEDGLFFEEIGTLNAAGNSSELTSYSFNDGQPIEGTGFYKITQYDIDGKFASTEVIQITSDLDLDLDWTHVGPNPVTDRTQLGFSVPENLNLTLQVFDLGQKGIEAQRGSNSHTLDMDGMPSGMFIVRLSHPKGRLEKKIIKL